MSQKPSSRTSIDKEPSQETHVEAALESTRNALGEETAHVTDHAAEMRLTWKLDTRLLPVLAFMYLCNALDKGNLGNAKTDHMDTDLGKISWQPIQYYTYVLFAFPIGLLGKRYGPANVLPIMMFSFGSMTLLGAAVRNFGGMMTVRWFLGMAESAFFPLVIYYLTCFYRRGELARRLAIFYAASNIANAFSGLLAFGVFQIKGGTLRNWRYLFLIEGSMTVLFSIFAFIYLPRSTEKARFFNEAEKALAFKRIQTDSSAIVNEKLVVREAIKVFRMPQAWVWLGIEICLGVPLQSVSLFLPQIVQRLGYDTVKTNLLTVAPNISGAVMLLILAFASDFTRLRFPFITLGFSLPVIGFIIYAAIDVLEHKRVAYFACFMMTWGTSAPSVLLSSWYNNNVAAESRRIALTSIGVPVANLMGILSSNIFFPSSAPAYLPALITTASFGAVGMVLAFTLGTWMRIDNARRDKRQGVRLQAQDVSTAILHEGPANPSFRWFL
ncbi:Uncharacterized transporter C1039.04 [Serendipita indica DSM 11827]|uniref:Related to putative tartrate transporter n=1 Tax=Serendipita indica (strain DSM 11827) TaxID=1109443 RepID=G4T833_SERID|nr:Uncharacterized transporter C1039.04 [Serendipita indica DSM 11827]CCA67457.1 related to putative tartrate transporter [Serendipita indica DSM 11827]